LDRRRRDDRGESLGPIQTQILFEAKDLMNRPGHEIEVPQKNKKAFAIMFAERLSAP
jgi:hypothetical protein